MKSTVEKAMRWLRSPAGIASASLLLVSILLIAAGLSNWSCVFHFPAESLNSILFGLATNLLGIIITISFVQHFLNMQRMKEEKSEEINRILRNDRIMSATIREYTLYYNRLTTPTEKIRSVSNCTLNLAFDFSDLRDLYTPTMLLLDGFRKTAIEAFCDSESNLIKCCYSFVQDVDFKFYPELCDVLLQIIEISNKFNSRGALLGNQEIFATQEAELLQHMFKNKSTNWVEEVHSGRVQGNIIIPYVFLYDLLKKEGTLVTQYCALIEKIRSQAGEMHFS